MDQPEGSLRSKRRLTSCLASLCPSAFPISGGLYPNLIKDLSLGGTNQLWVADITYIHHSDRDVQYASLDYVKELEFYGLKVSMSRKGNPYDNAYAESFMKTLKSEEVHLWEYRTIEDVQRRVPYFIEDVYNQKRFHSALGYRLPCEVETLESITTCQDTLITAL